jgi:hypothetical protein
MKKIKSEDCGPGCDCGKPSGNTKAKAVVCLVVLLSVCGIFVYKAKTAKQTAPVVTTSAFAAPVANATSQQKPDSDNQNTVAKVVDDNEAASPIEEKKIVGQFLDSLASLNKVAVNQDAVFLFVPAKENDIVGNETFDAIASAEQKIESKGVKIGLYTLQLSSPEYANLAAQLTLPGMLVMSKGRSMGAVSGEITEEKILQAYVASSQAGGCGPSGCGPSSSGCGPSSPLPGPRL